MSAYIITLLLRVAVAVTDPTPALQDLIDDAARSSCEGQP